MGWTTARHVNSVYGDGNGSGKNDNGSDVIDNNINNNSNSNSTDIRKNGNSGNLRKTIGQKWEDKDVMTMSGQQHTEHLQALCHPSKASIN